MAQGKRILTSIHGDAGWIPGLTEWVKDLYCRELRCRSQMLLGSHVAVALVWAMDYSSDSPPRLGISICRGCNPKKKKKKKTNSPKKG